MVQAGQYSSVYHYLKAVKAANSDEAGAVMAMMKKTPINDFFATNGQIRDDGRMIHDMYLAHVITSYSIHYTKLYDLGHVPFHQEAFEFR